MAWSWWGIRSVRALLGELRSTRAAGPITLLSKPDGVLFWLGCGQALMGNIVEHEGHGVPTDRPLLDRLGMGMCGIGAPLEQDDITLAHNRSWRNHWRILVG
jgi:hypothetical protein